MSDTIDDNNYCPCVSILIHRKGLRVVMIQEQICSFVLFPLFPLFFQCGPHFSLSRPLSLSPHCTCSDLIHLYTSCSTCSTKPKQPISQRQSASEIKSYRCYYFSTAVNRDTNISFPVRECMINERGSGERDAWLIVPETHNMECRHGFHIGHQSKCFPRSALDCMLSSGLFHPREPLQAA